MRRKAPISATALRGQTIEPLGRHLNAAAAKEILSLRAEDRASRRIEELAEKCGQGELTPEERAEYQLFVDVGDLVALLQAKARRYLVEHPADYLGQALFFEVLSELQSDALQEYHRGQCLFLPPASTLAISFENCVFASWIFTVDIAIDQHPD